METSGFSGRWANVANGSEHHNYSSYHPSAAGALEDVQDSGREPRLSSLRPQPPSSSSSPSRKHRDPNEQSSQKGHRTEGDHGPSSSSDEGSTESSTATAPSAGATSTIFPAPASMNTSAMVSPKLQLSPTLGQAFALSAQSPSFTPACLISGPSSTESSSDPSPVSSSPSASVSPNSSRPTSSLMTRMGLGKRTGSGSSGATSNTSYIGDDVGGGAPVSLGAVGAHHGASAPHAAEAAKAKSSSPPVPGTDANNNELEREFQDGDKDLTTEQHDGSHPQPAAAAARVFSPFRPSSATASASFSALREGARNDSKLPPDIKPKETMPPEVQPTSPKPQALSNEAIEAAIQAAITGSSYSSGSEMHSSMRKRSVRSSGSGGGGSGYASERSESGEKGSGSGREDKASGSDSGRSHGPGGYGSGGDARSVPPRDTRTLLFVGNLPYRVRWQDLKDLFRRAGTVLRADVSLGPDNRSRGYGTVLLATATDAGRAIDMLNGYEWQTRVLEVRVDRVGGVGHIAPSGPAPALGMNQFEQMGPGNIPNMSMANINSNMGYSGPGGMYQGQMPSGMMAGMAPSSGAMHQPHPNTDFGGQQSPYFMNQGSGIPPQGQSMTSSASSATPGGPPGRTLFVGNLPYHVQWQDLKDLFRRVPSNHPIMQHHLQGGPQPIDPQGYPYPAIPPSLMTFNVLRTDVALGPDGRSKGFGTVVFSNVEEADRARRVFSGYDFNGRQLKVHYDRMTVPGPSAGSLAPTSLAHQMMGLGGGSNMPSPAGMQMGSGSPQLHEPQSQQHLGPWSNVHQSRFAAVDPTGMSSPMQMGREGSPLRGSSLRPPQASSEYDRLRELGQRPPLPHSQSVLTRPSHSAVRNLQHLERPSLSARTSRRDIDPYSSDDMDRARDRVRGWKLEDDRKGAGRGFGYDYHSGDEERGGVSSSQEDVTGSWERERQRDRAKEQQLFQLLHGSRSQQQQSRERGPVETRNPTTSSAPVSYPHSPVGGFARTSSGSSNASTTSSSPSMGHQHPYYSDRGVSHLTRTLSVASTASIYDNLENLVDEQGLGMGMIETMLARRMGADGGSRSENESRSRAPGGPSAAASTRSLPLGPANISAASAATHLAVRNWIEDQDEGSKAGPKSQGSTSSASESHRSLSNATSHSSGSGSESAHAPSSSRRTRPVVAPEPGSDADISEADEEDMRDDEDEGNDRPGLNPLQTLDDNLSSTESPVPPHLPRPRPIRMGSRRGAKSGISKAGDKTSGDRQHPGPIELPPPPPVIPLLSSSQGSKGSTTQSFGQILSEGLFQQHHPFATGEGHDYARFDYSGVPTVQAGSSGPADGGPTGPSAHWEGEGQSRQQQQAQEQYRKQQQQWLAMQHQAYSAHASPAAQQGIPPLTPSMPPFNLVPTSGSAVSHFQAKQRQQQQAASSRRFGTGAPGPLSLPASQFPVLYPGQGQQPLTPPAYLHPLGSPGSPYLLGPHHPLNPYGTQHQPYHPQAYGPHPLAQSFGDGMSPGRLPPPMLSPGHPMIPVMYPMVSPMGPPIGYGPTAMTPGAPLTATGDPYIHGAVGAPVQPGGGPQETRGYFDQVYTTPNPYGFRYETAPTGGEESGAGIEREILKDSSQFGKDDGPQAGPDEEGNTNENLEHRPAFMHSQSVALSAKEPSVAPVLKHANTEPAPGGR